MTDAFSISHFQRCGNLVENSRTHQHREEHFLTQSLRSADCVHFSFSHQPYTLSSILSCIQNRAIAIMMKRCAPQPCDFHLVGYSPMRKVKSENFGNLRRQSLAPSCDQPLSMASTYSQNARIGRFSIR